MGMYGNWTFRNITLDQDIVCAEGSVQLNDQRPCQVATFSGAVNDFDHDGIQVAKGHQVRATYTDADGDHKKFEGDVVDFGQDHLSQSDPDPGRWSFAAQDYTNRLEWTIIDDDDGGNRDVYETITERVMWIMGIAPIHGIGTAHVATISTEIGPFDYRGLSKKEALDQVKQFCLGLYYVDWEPEDPDNYVGELHFFEESSPESNPAPFDLSDDPVDDEKSYTDLTYGPQQGDFIVPPDQVYVQGNDVAIWYPEDPGVDEPIQAVVKSDNIKNKETAEAIGALAMAMWAESHVQGQFRTKWAGLEAGMQFSLVDSILSITSDFVVTGVTPNIQTSNLEDDGDPAGFTDWTVTFADRYACVSSVTDQLNNIIDHGGSDSGCHVTQLLPVGMEQDLSLTTGGGTQLFVFDGDDQLVKYKYDTLERVWLQDNAHSASGYVTHQPGSYVPANMASRAYRRDSGNQAWSIENALDVLAGHVQDRRRFWVTGTTESGGAVTFPYSGFGTFNANVGPTGNQMALVLWRGFVTSTGTVLLEMDGSGLMYFFGQAGLGWSFERLRWVTDMSWDDSGSPPDEATLAALGNVSNNLAAVGTVYKAKAAGWYGSAESPSSPSSPDGSGVGLGGVIAAGQWVMLAIWSDEGVPHTAASRPHGLQQSFTISGTATLDDPLEGPGAPAIQTRFSETGSLDVSAALGDDGDQIRVPVSEQFVAVKQGTGSIEFWDQTPAQTDTFTLGSFFPCHDWCVDDAKNVYRRDSGVLKKYKSDGTLLFTIDLGALYDYVEPSAVLSAWSDHHGQSIIVDSVIRIAGTNGDDEAMLLTLARANGDLKMKQRYGGESGSTAIASAVHFKVKDGIVYLAGIASGGTFEDKTFSEGTRGWVMKICETVSDTGTEGGDDPSHTHDAITTEIDDHIADTSDAHDASAISITDTGNYFTGTDVETALQELGAGGGGGGASDPTTTEGDLIYRTSGALDRLPVGADGEVLTSDGTDPAWSPLPVLIEVACSNETGALSMGAGKVTFRMPCAMTLTEVRASLKTAQASGSTFTVDINEAGSTILSTPITIDNTETTSTTAATPPVISDASLADDAEMTVDIDQIGDGTAVGLKIVLIGTRA